MKKTIFLAITLTTLLFTSCKEATNYMPNVSGASFEVLLVIPDSIYKTPAGEAMFNILAAPVEHLPQPEPQFKISRIPTNLFDNLLKTTRNIVFVTVDPTRYTTTKINLSRDKWAKTQAIVNITSPNTKELQEILEKEGYKLSEFIIRAERERMMQYYKDNINNEALKRVNKQFGCNIALPTSLNKYLEGDNFLWISNGSQTVNQNILIYSTPYTSVEQLTHESIMARRDSVLKENLPGSIKGSYMGTEYRHFPPETKIISNHNSWTAETRGLWRMCEGEIMGGPFVSLTRIDEQNSKIITVEGFIFAPSRDKRNSLRQLDAMVYSLLMPFEINQIVVTANNNQTK